MDPINHSKKKPRPGFQGTGLHILDSAVDIFMKDESAQSFRPKIFQVERFKLLTKRPFRQSPNFFTLRPSKPGPLSSISSTRQGKHHILDFLFLFL
jgi:hypothetical protein